MYDFDGDEENGEITVKADDIIFILNKVKIHYHHKYYLILSKETTLH